MGITKTLGGDRLGSGKKMQVHMHGFERSTHDLSYIFRSTMSAGTLVPFMYELGLPGDTFDIDLDCDIKTHPTIGPLFGSYKVQLDVFQAPIRLYNALLHNNMLGIGLDMTQVKFPTMTFNVAAAPDPGEEAPNIDTSQVNPSCLLAYAGIRGIGRNTTASTQTRSFQILFILAYWETYKNYYSNKQEEIGAVIHADIPPIEGEIVIIEAIRPDTTTVTIPSFVSGDPPTVDDYPAGTKLRLNWVVARPDPSTVYFSIPGWGLISFQDAVTGVVDVDSANYEGIWDFSKFGMNYIENWRQDVAANIPYTNQPTVYTFPLSNIDNARIDILAHPGATAWNIPTHFNEEPYSWLHGENASGIPFRLSSQEGLAVKTYQSDLFNNWLKTEYIDNINTITAIDTSGGSFNIEALVLGKKVYDMLNRIATSGGTYDDWLEVQYDHESIKRAESPIYHGGLIRELVFQEVVSNSQSETQPLGTLAGKGVMSQKRKGGKLVIRIDEPSILMGIVSLTPRPDYSQGNDWKIHLQTMNDLHVPMLDEIGYQDLVTEQMAWWDTENIAGTWTQKTAGKQPAWLNYMTNVNKTYGNFAIPDNEMFMTLNRRYEYNDGIDDLTTYIDPAKFNFIFAQTALDAQNFWCQIAVDITARRKMSGKLMPNL